MKYLYFFETNIFVSSSTEPLLDTVMYGLMVGQVMAHMGHDLLDRVKTEV